MSDYWIAAFFINGVSCCVLMFDRKSRNPLGGVLLGLALGILGGLIAACLADADESPDGHRSFSLAR